MKTLINGLWVLGGLFVVCAFWGALISTIIWLFCFSIPVGMCVLVLLAFNYGFNWLVNSSLKQINSHVGSGVGEIDNLKRIIMEVRDEQRS